MINADAYYNKSDHLTRIMTGLHFLEEQKLLKCRYIEDKEHAVLPESSAILELRIAGKRIAFDLRDASALHQPKLIKYLAAVDMYFERSHRDWSSEEAISAYVHKIHPFGFNYFTSYPGNPALVKSDSGSYVKRFIRDVVNNSRSSRVEAFEGKADYQVGKKPRIIFMSRLWNPADVRIREDATPQERSYREGMIRERQRINADRIEICRSLKSIYGDSFCGGIQDSTYAAAQCPDLILPGYLTIKSNYLRQMKKADICIGSAGLEKSIGWKTGEYVAAARAIVCEEFAYLLPGNFAEGQNYLPYHDVESCLAAVEALCQNPQAIYQMQLANQQYYQAYLRPDVQILNALEKSGISVS